MTNAKLLVEAADKKTIEYEVANHASIGSATDNQLRLGGQGIALYHAIIAKVNDAYLISDIGNSGTLVNGRPVQTNYALSDGDLISIGAATKIKFLLPAAQIQTAATAPAPDPVVNSGLDSATASGDTIRSQAVTGGAQSSEAFSLFHIALGLTVGLSIVGLVALGYYLLRPDRKVANGTDCGAIRIVKPVAGAIVNSSTTISVNADKPGCIRRISYLLDGQPFASPEANPFEAVLDPTKIRERFPQLAAGSHKLSVEIEGGKLRVKPEAVEITLNFVSSGDGIDLEFIREKAEALAGQLSGGNGSDFIFEVEFLGRIRDQTHEFRTDFYAAAEQYKFEINRTFRNDVGLSELFGYILALSRSRFVEGAGVNGCGVSMEATGLWRLPQNILRQVSQSGLDPKQEVSIAANHFKDLLNYFDGNEGFMYAVACFGESGERAGKVLQRVPDANQRRNFWELKRAGVLTEEEVNRLVCFMAAGIVAQNPARFGINSQSLSIRMR